MSHGTVAVSVQFDTRPPTSPTSDATCLTSTAVKLHNKTFSSARLRICCIQCSLACETMNYVPWYVRSVRTVRHPTSTFADKRCHLPYIYCRQINQRDLQLCTSTVNGLSQHLPRQRFYMVQRHLHSRLLHHITNSLRSTVRALYITTSSRKLLYLSLSTQLS